MDGEPDVLTTAQARAYYDRFGKKQDTQGFYEDPATDDLIAHADLAQVRNIFEFGCGTGKFAARLLSGHLSPTADYTGCDVSPVMVALATQRLTEYGARATVLPSDGKIAFPMADRSVDCIVSNYMLDLLSIENISSFFAEAHGTPTPGGKLCLVSLTTGTTTLSRIVSSTWAAIFRIKPSLVGGSRPTGLGTYVDNRIWQQRYKSVVISFGVLSEVMILSRS